MTRYKSHLAMTAVALVAITALATPARAALITYSNQATWLGAVGPLSGTEDFNGFAADASFISPAFVAANNMKLSAGNGLNGAVTNKIDASPFVEAGYAADATAFALVDLVAGNTLRIDFTAAVRAWGADFDGISDDGRISRIDVFDTSNVLLGSITAATAAGTYNLRFIGFDLTGGSSAGHLEFVLTNPAFAANDAFGIDNVGFVNAPVPEPTTLALLGAGLVATRLRRRASR